MSQLVNSVLLAADAGAARVNVRVEPLPPAIRLLAGNAQGLVLAGHQTPAEFQAFRDFHNPGLAASERKRLNRFYADAVEHTRGLVPVQTDAAVVGAIEDDRSERLRMSPTFVEAFGRTRTHFSWVDPQLVVPTQAYVRVNARNDPEVGASLFELAFPPQAQPRFEVVAAGSGVFYMVSDSPHINALRPAVNPLGGGLFSVTVGMYTNFVLIAHFGAMYCARNGTHRLEWAVRVGVPRVPALILEAATSAEASVALGIEGFHVETLAKQRRPPTIADFGTIAGVRMPMRISRYGWTVHTRGLHRA